MALPQADLAEMGGSSLRIAADATSGKKDIAHPEPLSRRRLLKSILGFGVVGTSGAYGREIEPFWVEWHDIPMPLRNLPKSFEGFRLLQLTDLHASDNVPM